MSPFLKKISKYWKSNFFPFHIKNIKYNFNNPIKNPPNKKAWELIKVSNCSNLIVGGASISTQHCNFFQNNGNASSADIEKLIETVKEKVFLKTGTNLELEIKIVGAK